MAMVASVSRSRSGWGRRRRPYHRRSSCWIICSTSSANRASRNRHDRRRFGHELFGIALVDADRVELEQDLEQLVVQGAILSLEAFTRRPPLLGFVVVYGLVHAANGP
jgi:hypothetical protein